MGLEVDKIYLGDSLVLCDKIPDKSVDMILEDMPYGTTACKWDIRVDLEQYWESRKRIIKDNGAIVLTASQPFTSILVMSNLKMFKYEWIWEKNWASNFPATKKVPQKRHENILIYYKTAPIYNEIRIPKNEASINRYKYAIQATKFNKKNIYGKLGFQDKQKNKNYRHPTMQHPHSILYFVKEQFLFHPTQKPVALFEYLIKTYTNEGDLVFDGFAGSGTTGVACKNLNRRFICIEKEQEYFEKAEKRIDDVPMNLFNNQGVE